ncbi:MAG: glycosyltransferase family 2 protein [Chloroflexi bacterium]|nr:glycosyltransferase family 2 protein [Chloroflexota bacterium]
MRLAPRHHNTLRKTSWLLLLAGIGVSGLVNMRRWRSDGRLAEKLRGAAPPRQPLKETSRVSILVAAWNEGARLRPHIESVLRLRYPNREYILAAGGNDGTYELARTYAGRCTVLEQLPGEGKQRALRRCLAAATGDVIFLTDADCVLDDDSFEAVIAPILDKEVQATSGGSRARRGASLGLLASYRWAADAYAEAHMPDEIAGLLGRNCALSRQALRAAGDFQEDVASGTDYHLAQSLVSAGFGIRHVAGSMVETDYPDRYRAYARQQRRWLRNLVLHGWRFGARRDAMVSLVTSLVGLGMCLAPIAAVVLGPVIWAAWIVAVIHSSLSKLRYLAFTARRFHPEGPRLSPTLVAGLVPLTMFEFGVWALPLLDYVIPKRRTQW